MLQLMEDKEIYLEQFAALEKRSSGEPAWLAERRTAAMDRFAEIGFPTVRDEEWRFTNVAPLVQATFGSATAFGMPPAELDKLAYGVGPCNRLVFVNGRFAPSLSKVISSGIVVRSLAEALKSDPAQVQPHLAEHASYDENAFVALNTGFIQDGAFVHIGRGKLVQEPIHLVFVSTVPGEPTVCHPRNLIVADVSSQFSLVETYAGSPGQRYFTNAVTEIVAGDNSIIDHYKIHRESIAAFHIATMQVRLARSANFSSHNIVLGGGLVRNDINAYLGGEGIECTLNGLYVGSGRQLIDTHTRIDHAMPHCASHELYKGILDGQARGVFNGKIFVHPDAQKTDAKQTNKTLLLSDDATINSKPQLEIFADDVKCTHGATIGQLADEAIFYLRSRGLGKDEARSLLTYAFANDIVSRVKIEPLRAQLEQIFLDGRPAKEGL